MAVMLTGIARGRKPVPGWLRAGRYPAPVAGEAENNGPDGPGRREESLERASCPDLMFWRALGRSGVTRPGMGPRFMSASPRGVKLAGAACQARFHIPAPELGTKASAGA